MELSTKDSSCKSDTFLRKNQRQKLITNLTEKQNSKRTTEERIDSQEILMLTEETSTETTGPKEESLSKETTRDSIAEENNLNIIY